MNNDISSCSPSDCATCGANCSSNTNMSEEHRTITLTLEDDSEVTCEIITTFKQGGNEYIALLPHLAPNAQGFGEVYLFRFGTTAQGDPMLANIEEDAEYEAAAEAFNALVLKAQQLQELDEAAGETEE